MFHSGNIGYLRLALMVIIGFQWSQMDLVHNGWWLAMIIDDDSIIIVNIGH